MSTKKFSKAFNVTNNKDKGYEKLKSKESLKGNYFRKSSDKLNPITKSSFRFYNDNTNKSQHLKDCEFTNFLNDNQVSDYKFRVVPFFNNFSEVIKNNARIYSLDFNKRIENIFLNYLESQDFHTIKDDIRKVNLLNSLNNSTQYRIFLYKEIEKNEYVVILIDPLHLVIPDKITRDNNIYKSNINNSICISSLL